MQKNTSNSSDSRSSFRKVFSRLSRLVVAMDSRESELHQLELQSLRKRIENLEVAKK